MKVWSSVEVSFYQNQNEKAISLWLLIAFFKLYISTNCNIQPIDIWMLQFNNITTS